MPAMTGNQGSKVHQRTKTGKTKIVRKTGGCKVVSAVSTTEQQDTSVRRATLTHRERFVKRIGMKLKKFVKKNTEGDSVRGIFEGSEGDIAAFAGANLNVSGDLRLSFSSLWFSCIVSAFSVIRFIFYTLAIIMQEYTVRHANSCPEMQCRASLIIIRCSLLERVRVQERTRLKNRRPADANPLLRVITL